MKRSNGAIDFWRKHQSQKSERNLATARVTSYAIHRCRPHHSYAHETDVAALCIIQFSPPSWSDLIRCRCRRFPFSREGPKEARFAATQSMPQNLFNFTLFYSCTLTIACTVHFLMLVACRLKRFLTCFFVIQNFVVLLLFLKIN